MLQKYYQCIVLCLVFNVYSHSLESLQEGAFPRSSPDGLNWYREVHPPVAAPSGGAQMEMLSLPLRVYPSLWSRRWFVLMLLLLQAPSLTAELMFPNFHHGIGTSGSSGVFLAPARLGLLRYPTLWTELWIIPLHSAPSELRCLLGQLRLLRFSPKDQVLRGSEVTWLSLLEAPLRDFDGMQSASWLCSSEKLMECSSLLVLFFRTEADRSRWLQSCHLQDLFREDEITDV